MGSPASRNLYEQERILPRPRHNPHSYGQRDSPVANISFVALAHGLAPKTSANCTVPSWRMVSFMTQSPRPRHALELTRNSAIASSIVRLIIVVVDLGNNTVDFTCEYILFTLILACLSHWLNLLPNRYCGARLSMDLGRIAYCLNMRLPCLYRAFGQGMRCRKQNRKTLWE